MTQPAFSRRIRALEEWLGTELFDRSSQPARLTAAGEWFRDIADELTARVTRIPGEVKAVAETHSTTLRFAATPRTLGDIRGALASQGSPEEVRAFVVQLVDEQLVLHHVAQARADRPAQERDRQERVDRADVAREHDRFLAESEIAAWRGPRRRSHRGR